MINYLKFELLIWIYFNIILIIHIKSVLIEKPFDNTIVDKINPEKTHIENP